MFLEVCLPVCDQDMPRTNIRMKPKNENSFPEELLMEEVEIFYRVLLKVAKY